MCTLTISELHRWFIACILHANKIIFYMKMNSILIHDWQGESQPQSRFSDDLISKWFIMSAVFGNEAMCDCRSSSIVVLECILISFRQLNERSNWTDVTGMVHAIFESLLNSKKASLYCAINRVTQSVRMLAHSTFLLFAFNHSW